MDQRQNLPAYSDRMMEQLCRAQAAHTMHEPTRRELVEMAEEYRVKAEYQERGH